MFNENLLDNSAGWIIFFGSVILMMAGNYFGYRFGKWHLDKAPETKDSANSEIMGAIFGILGFTLAFLFGMSLTRMEHKKELVVSEASAILGAFENAQFLPEPHKNQCSRMLVNYASLRFQLAQDAREKQNMGTLREGILLSERIQDSLLREAFAVSQIPNADVSNFRQSISAAIDLNMKRIQNSTGDRIPRALKILMYAMALLGLAGMGYASGLKGGRSLVPNIILVMVFATIIGIILDMDHPVNALFKVSQQPMQDVLRRISSMHI
nr:hypothetical protein [Flavihumibacter fluvii]